MRPKSLILLALALSCGLVASIGISQVMDRNANNGPTKIETSPIYVALHNINLGDPIDSTMVELQEWPKEKVPSGALTQLEDLEGRRPRGTIFEGMPIVEAGLLAPGQVADPISSIPKDMRLITLSVDAETSAAGLLSPGDRVDVQVFVKRNPSLGIESPRVKVILQNIRVFAVDANVQRSADGTESRKVSSTVSLVVTPQQASKVTLAQKLGDVSLIPRNPNDEDVSIWANADTAEILDDVEAGSRRREQGAGAGRPSLAAGLGSLVAAVQSGVSGPAPEKPFMMEIIEQDSIRYMEFDAKTGKPIRHAAPAGPAASAAPPWSQTSAGPSPAAPESADARQDDMDEFPIDLDSLDELTE